MFFNELVHCASTPIGCWSATHHGFLTRFNYALAKGTQVLGSPKLAISWMIEPAIGLGYKSPCCLLTQQAGFSKVNELLIRIEYGVYI